jgi:hypothetical protein
LAVATGCGTDEWINAQSLPDLTEHDNGADFFIGAENTTNGFSVLKSVAQRQQGPFLKWLI